MVVSKAPLWQCTSDVQFAQDNLRWTWYTVHVTSVREFRSASGGARRGSIPVPAPSPALAPAPAPAPAPTAASPAPSAPPAGSAGAAARAGGRAPAPALGLGAGCDSACAATGAGSPAAASSDAPIASSNAFPGCGAGAGAGAPVALCPSGLAPVLRGGRDAAVGGSGAIGAVLLCSSCARDGSRSAGDDAPASHHALDVTWRCQAQTCAAQGTNLLCIQAKVLPSGQPSSAVVSPACIMSNRFSFHVCLAACAQMRLARGAGVGSAERLATAHSAECAQRGVLAQRAVRAPSLVHAWEPHGACACVRAAHVASGGQPARVNRSKRKPACMLACTLGGQGP